MTLLPLENRNIIALRGDKYPDYKVGPICSAPGCSKFTDHAHHLWRRSFTAGACSWIKLPDDTVTGNLCGLCWRHHEEVTVNTVQIVWSNGFYWKDHQGGYVRLLDPQPPRYPTNVTEEPQKAAEALLDGPASNPKCPSCKRTLPHTHDKKKEGTRKRVQWSIHVPQDQQEDGADVLDTLVEECGKIFGHDENKRTKYFTVVQALALVVQNGNKLVSES